MTELMLVQYLRGLFCGAWCETAGCAEMNGAYAFLANAEVFDQFSADVFGVCDQRVGTSQRPRQFTGQPGHSFRGVVVRIMNEGEIVDGGNAWSLVRTQNEVGLVIYEIA